jgi:hypothetical protein
VLSVACCAVRIFFLFVLSFNFLSAMVMCYASLHAGGRLLPLRSFLKDVRLKTGYASSCRLCQNAKRRASHKCAQPPPAETSSCTAQIHVGIRDLPLDKFPMDSSRISGWSHTCHDCTPMKEKEKELSPVVAKKQTATTRDPADVVWYDASQDVWCDSINEMRAQRETCADD